MADVTTPNERAARNLARKLRDIGFTTTDAAAVIEALPVTRFTANYRPVGANAKAHDVLIAVLRFKEEIGHAP